MATVVRPSQSNGLLIYLAYVPAFTVVVMFAGANSLSTQRTFRLAIYVSSTIWALGVIVSVVTGSIGSAISSTAPLAFLLWYRLVQPLFAWQKGAPPVVTGPGRRDGGWWDYLYTLALVVGASVIGAYSMIVLNWFGSDNPPPVPV